MLLKGLQMAFGRRSGSDQLNCDLTLGLEFREVRLRNDEHGHETFIEGCDFSIDSRKLLMCTGNGYLLEYSLESQELYSWKAHEEEIWNVKYSPDGSMIASCSSDRLVKLWSSYQKNLLCVLSGHADTVWTSIFLHKRGKIASCSSDHRIVIWDFMHPKVVADGADELDGKQNDGSDAGISKSQLENQELFFKGHKAIPFSHLIVNILTGHKDVIEDVAVSNGGRYLVSCSRDRTIRLWKHYLSDSQTSYKTLRGHRERVLSCNFPSHREDMLASTSADKTVIVWNLKTRNVIWQLKGHFSMVWATCFIRQKSTLLLVSCSSDHSIRVWDITTGIELWVTKELESDIDIPPQLLYCASSPDCRTIAVTSSIGKIYLANLN